MPREKIIEPVWEYEVCDITTAIGSTDANKLLEDHWEPFAGSAGPGLSPTKDIGMYLWLRKLVEPES